MDKCDCHTVQDEKLILLDCLHCHAQSLAATNRVTEQLSWLAVESFFMSCSISSVDVLSLILCSDRNLT